MKLKKETNEWGQKIRMGVESRNNYKGTLWDAGDVLCLHQGDSDVCIHRQNFTELYTENQCTFCSLICV